MTNQTRTRRAVSHLEFYRVCEWAKHADFTGIHHPTTAAEKAAEVMGFAVSTSTIAAVLETVGVTLPPPPKVRTPTENEKFLAGELLALYKSLGEKPSPALLAFAGVTE